MHAPGRAELKRNSPIPTDNVALLHALFLLYREQGCKCHVANYSIAKIHDSHHEYLLEEKYLSSATFLF